MFLFFLAQVCSELIKHTDADMYICDLSDIGLTDRVPMGCHKGDATEWILDRKNEDEILLRTKRNGDVLDEFEGELVLRPYVEEKEQMFKIVDKGNNDFLLQLNDKCVELSPFTSTYKFKKCGDSELQHFKFIKVPQPSLVRYTEKEINHIKKRDIIVPRVYFNHKHHKHPSPHKKLLETFISRAVLRRRDRCWHKGIPIINTTDFQPCKRIHSHFNDESNVKKLIF